VSPGNFLRCILLLYHNKHIKSYALLYWVLVLGMGSLRINEILGLPRYLSGMNKMSSLYPQLPLPSIILQKWFQENPSPCLDRSVGRSHCCWPSSAQSLVLGVFEICDQEFCSLLYKYVFRIGASSSTRWGVVFLCRRYVRCTEPQRLM
jgi:hypothetical protein